MAYSVDWEARIITIPQADLVYLEPNRYKLDLDEFRRKCRQLEWSFEGLSYPPIIQYYPAVDTGDVILGRVVLCINGYQVELEDTVERYSALFDGANTNVHNNCLITNGIPTPNNSAGLQDLSTLLSMAYGGQVVLNTTRGQAGSSTPIGTRGVPVNNVLDALKIMDSKNCGEILLQGPLTLTTGHNLSGRSILGENELSSILTVEAGADTYGLKVTKVSFTGTLDGGAILQDCVLYEVRYFAGYIYNCAFTSNTIFINGIGLFMNTRNGATCTSPPIIDMTDGLGLGIRDHVGDLDLVNKTGPGLCKIHLSGQLRIFPSCTGGTIIVYGDAYVTDDNGNPYVNGDGKTQIIDRTTATKEEIAEEVWGHTIP